MRRIVQSLLVISVLFFVGCKSEQEKAFDSVLASRDLNELRSFKATYDESLSEKLLSKYEAAYEKLIKDSTLYAAIEYAGSTLEKYNAEKEYITVLPDGIHVDEINIVLPEHKAAAELIVSKLESMRKAFKQYKFIEAEYMGREAGTALYDYGDEYEFSGPDDSGRGEVIIKSNPPAFVFNESDWFRGNSGFGSYRYHAVLTRECSADSYIVDDDFKIVFTINEKRSLESEMVPRGNNDAPQEELDAMKPRYDSAVLKNYPEPKPRKMMLVFNDEEDFPSLSGIDSNRNNIYFETEMK